MDSDIRRLIWDRAKKYYPVKASHGLNHIEDNLNMAEKMLAFAKEPFTDQIYAAIVFHDSGLEKYGREIHEVHSAEIAKRELKDLFNSKDLFLIAAAIREHRASFKGEFTSMLSDICSSADRNAPNFEASVARAFLYTSEHHPEFSFEEKCETVATHLKKKYGSNGYARFPIYYSRYYGKDLANYKRKMDGLNATIVEGIVGKDGKNASKLYDASLEALSDKVSSNITDHASPKEFVDEKKLEMKELPTNPSDKELQLFLNSTNEASKASNDELWTLQDLKNKFKRPNRKLCHYFLFHYDGKPIGGVMYMDPDDQCRAFSIGDFAIYKEYRGKGFGSKCFKMLLDKIKKSNSTLPIYLGVHVNNTKAIELYKKFGFKIAKTMEENGNKFHQMFLGKPIEFKSDEKQNGATESLLDHDATNIVESKMYFANNNGKIPKDANGNIVLTKDIIDATICAAFDQFNDSKVAMACKEFMQYKDGTNKHVIMVHGDDSLTEPEEMDCVGTIYLVTLSEPIEFRYHGHRGFGKCQYPELYTVKEEALKDAQVKKKASVKFKATFEYEESLTMQHATENLDIEAGLIQELNAGIEEFHHWARDLELYYLKQRFQDPQVEMVYSQIAQENILVNTVKEIFKKIAQFIAWFFKKLKDLWNYFFGRMQRKIRLYRSLRDTTKKYLASNAYFNEKAFRDYPAPTGMVVIDEMLAMMDEAWAPDKLHAIFKEIFDLWEKDPMKLHDIITIDLVAQKQAHRFWPLVHTGYGNGVGKGIQDVMLKLFPAKGTIYEAGLTSFEDVDEYCKSIDTALTAYLDITKLFSAHGDIMTQAQRRILDYADRTDITEKEASEMANKVKALSGILKNLTDVYTKSFEFILGQGIMVMETAHKFLKK